MGGLIGWLRRTATTSARECAGCGAAMTRTEEACPQGCGYDRRAQRRLDASAWSRIDRR